MSAGPVGLIAGGGALPSAVADSIAADGVAPVLFALRGSCDPTPLARYRHHWIRMGQGGRLFRLLRSEGCRDVVFIGSLVRPALSEIRLDWTTMRLMPAIVAAFRGGDDRLLTGIGHLFEREGFTLRGIADVAPGLLMPEGRLTRAAPDDSAAGDIATGRAVLAALGRFDIGQAVVVIEGHVVGIEDIEGTDGLLRRIARLRAERRIRASAGRGVLVKAAKTTQDLRFDLPTVGVRTVENAIAAGLGGIAVAARQSLVADAQAVIAAADKAGMFVVGMPA